MITELSLVARVSLGYKSLQNNFFYVNQATIDTYGIEARFLSPIFTMREIDTQQYIQDITTKTWLFSCNEKRADLRGTGALRYIDAMANHSAAEKKQSGKSQTIREALEAQGGSLWYAPKAAPHRHHVWLRKAFGGVYAPFLFRKATLIDQRCNAIAPLEGFTWEEIGALLTTTLFAYSVEINGSASMGAGALEAATTKLREYPVLDLAQLSSRDRKQLTELANAVWQSEAPVDWSSPTIEPGARLRVLDAWVLKKLDRGVTVETLYKDVREVCQSRSTVANDKVKKTKKSRTDNIGNVAEAIALGIIPKLQSRNFPDDFVDGGQSSDINLTFDRNALRRISLSYFLDTAQIEIISSDGKPVYEASHPKAVGEAIARAILWGRSAFSLASDEKLMNRALDKFLPWATEIDSDVSRAISESALGTGYEDAVKREVYSRLGIHPLAGAKVLPHEISL